MADFGLREGSLVYLNAPDSNYFNSGFYVFVEFIDTKMVPWISFKFDRPIFSFSNGTTLSMVQIKSLVDYGQLKVLS